MVVSGVSPKVEGGHWEEMLYPLTAGQGLCGALAKKESDSVIGVTVQCW